MPQQELPTWQFYAPESRGESGGCGPGAPVSSASLMNIPGSSAVPIGEDWPSPGSQSFLLSGPGRTKQCVCSSGGQREGCAGQLGRALPPPPPATASFPKKEPFEAAVAGPAGPPQPRQTGSRALPRGTRGRFTPGLASPASHAHSVHTRWPPGVPCTAVFTHKSLLHKPAPGSGDLTQPR